jgi:hypothetical protein
MCNAKPKSFTDRLFGDIARFIDMHLMTTCQVSHFFFLFIYARSLTCSIKSIVSQSDSLPEYAKSYELFETAMRRIDILCEYLNRMIDGPDALPKIVGNYRKQPIYTVSA